MRTKLLALLASLTAILTLATATPAAAAPIAALDITAVGYNAYGADTADNRNSEYVEVKNVTTAAVNVRDLIVQDAWARGRDKTTGCNTFRLGASVLPVAEGAAADELPGGALLRVHMGSGAASIDRAGVRHVYANMRTVCGYNGHIFNNSRPGSNRWAAWDTAWITVGADSESRSYNFSAGYVAR